MIRNPSYFVVLCVLVTLVTCFSLRKTDSYVVAESKEYAYYAGLAYCPKKCIEEWNCQGGRDLKYFGEVTHINNFITNASAYVGY